MDLTGEIKFIGEEQQVSDKFRKRDFVITDNSSQYPQHVSFQLTQDKCGLIDKHKIGDLIKVHFNLRGREWTSPKNEVKYFNTLECWRIEGNASSGSNNSNSNSNNNSPSDFSNGSTQEDDLPF